MSKLENRFVKFQYSKIVPYTFKDLDESTVLFMRCQLLHFLRKHLVGQLFFFLPFLVKYSPASVSGDSKVTSPDLSLFVPPILNDPTFQTLQIAYVFQSQKHSSNLFDLTRSRSREIMEKFISLRIPVQCIESSRIFKFSTF